MSSEQKPNILEVDGLIVRGSDGKPRAAIIVRESPSTGEYVEFEIYAAGSEEAAFYVNVNAEGRTHLCVDYVGLVDGDVDVAPGVELDSGTRETLPRFRVHGRGPGRHDDPVFEIPEQSEEGRRAELIRALVEAGAPYRDLHPVTIADAIEDASEELCEGGVISVARNKHWRKSAAEVTS